jgi:hypothetical protein
VISIDWLMRGALGVGGALLVWQALPVSKGAWQAQVADPVYTNLRKNYAVNFSAVLDALDAMDRSVAADPNATRLIQRSELLASAALLPAFNPTPEQRTAWLKQADADLTAGLGEDPARGIAWLRLVSVRLALNGPSQATVTPLLMSIDTSAMMEPIWPVRLQLILVNWQVLTPEQRETLSMYVARTWQLSTDRRWFAQVINSPIDELFVRYFLRDEAGAQDELTRLLAEKKK